MHRVQKARARARGYGLLSQFVAHGLRAEMLPALRQVAAVAPTLPDPFDADQAAATHYDVFGLNIFAAEGVFTDPTAQRGGACAARVRAAYARGGFTPPTDLEVDDLGCEFAALAHLCAAEADAWEDGQTGAAEQARALQARFMGEHLLCWLPAVCEALQRRSQPLYATAGVLLSGFVADHAGELAPQAPSPSTDLPAPPAADAAETRLATITDWLLAPVCCGFLLTRDDLLALAATCALPAPFGDRRATLSALMHGAGEYEVLPALLNALDRRSAEAGAAYALQADDNPGAAPWVRLWIERTTATHALLAAMRAQAA